MPRYLIDLVVHVTAIADNIAISYVRESELYQSATESPYLYDNVWIIKSRYNAHNILNN